MYEIVQVPEGASDLPEQLGTKQKFWFLREGSGLWLFKVGRPNTGENWAEKVCCEIAKSLGLPRANYELAKWREFTGVASPTFVSDRGRLILGNELLARIFKEYPQEPKVRPRLHKVSIVAVLMASRAGPPTGLPFGWPVPPGDWKPFDVFTGYLMLDALVSNQDRHHENWGFILDRDGNVSLAPTFDHASSLGRNERDEERVRRLTTKDRGSSIEHYVERAKSAFFNFAGKPVSPLEAFTEATKFSGEAAQFWLGKLALITQEQFEQIFRLIPPTEISEPAVQFALKILEVNRLRLLASYRS